jgi:hypothetical protein
MLSRIRKRENTVRSFQKRENADFASRFLNSLGGDVALPSAESD